MGGQAQPGWKTRLGLSCQPYIILHNQGKAHAKSTFLLCEMGLSGTLCYY
jgi:hypothetical protein